MIIETKCYGKTIFFDDVKHRFFHEDGSSIKSVTTFSGIPDKPYLLPWAVDTAMEHLEGLAKGRRKITIKDLDYAASLPFQKKTEAADLGTKIHEQISKYIKKEPIDIDLLMSQDEKVAQGFLSFLEWEKKEKPIWLDSEKIVYSNKYNYAGIFDATAKIGGKRILVDFKSSNAIYDEYALQTGGYQQADEEMNGEKYDGRLVLRFSKLDEVQYYAVENAKLERKKRRGKNYEIKPYKLFEEKYYWENDKDIEAFNSAMILGRRLDELKKNG